MEEVSQEQREELIRAREINDLFQFLEFRPNRLIQGILDLKVPHPNLHQMFSISKEFDKIKAFCDEESLFKNIHHVHIRLSPFVPEMDVIALFSAVGRLPKLAGFKANQYNESPIGMNSLEKLAPLRIPVKALTALFGYARCLKTCCLRALLDGTPNEFQKFSEQIHVPCNFTVLDVCRNDSSPPRGESRWDFTGFQSTLPPGFAKSFGTRGFSKWDPVIVAICKNHESSMKKLVVENGNSSDGYAFSSKASGGILRLKAKGCFIKLPCYTVLHLHNESDIVAWSCHHATQRVYQAKDPTGTRRDVTVSFRGIFPNCTSDMVYEMIDRNSITAPNFNFRYCAINHKCGHVEEYTIDVVLADSQLMNPRRISKILKENMPIGMRSVYRDFHCPNEPSMRFYRLVDCGSLTPRLHPQINWRVCFLF